MFGSNLWITNFESGGWRCISWLSQLTPRKSFTFSHRAIWNIFLLLTKWNDYTFRFCGKAYCHSRLGKKPCSVTLAQHFYILSSIFSPRPQTFILETIFPLYFSVIFFIWLSLQCSIEQACYTHLIYSWFEGNSISVLMILNHLVGNKICIFCNFIPYSGARLHSGLLMISATAPGPLSFIFYPLSFLSLLMKMKNTQRPHGNCKCTRSSLMPYLLTFILYASPKKTLRRQWVNTTASGKIMKVEKRRGEGSSWISLP